METAKNVLRTIEGYVFWLGICLGIINLCWSFGMATTQNPKMGEIFYTFEVVALVSGITLILVTIKDYRSGSMEDYEMILPGIVGMASMIASLAWLNSF